MWVLKPNDCNRGRGVQVFNKLDEMKKLINEAAGSSTIEVTDETQKVKSDLFVI